MTEPVWSAGARRRVAGRSVVLVGIGPGQLLCFATAGAYVAGVVSVVPAGGPPAPPDVEGVPLLTIEGSSRDVLDHVVRGYAEAVVRHAVEVEAFLDQVDPGHGAAVVSYLPIPHGTLGGRACWTADAGVSAGLEAKVARGGLLAGVVPTVESVPCPAGPAQRWWADVCDALAADRLVVQRAGLSGGGTGTWVCSSAADVPTLSGDAIVSPFVEGRSGNVMGVVDETGTTIVLPASRQLLRIEGGRPLYAGNVTGETWASTERSSIEAEVRAIGTALAGAGFFGPFGVDFIDGPDGRRYHDLNPRMNGVADSLAWLVDADGTVPLVAALLARGPWTAAEVASIEDTLHDAASGRPLARLWLTRTVERSTTITPPPAGAWRISCGGATASFVGGDIGGDLGGDIAGGTAVGGDLTMLHPLVPPGLTVVPGDRLALGNLFCDPDLVAVLGDAATGPTLVDAFLA